MMKEERLEIAYKIFNSAEELSKEDNELVKKAFEAVKNAYAPYSTFHVGAALRLENGRIIKGSNQENVASPTTSCAERSALFYAGSNFPGEKIESIAIASQCKTSQPEDLLTPCGNCRQALLEYENKQNNPIRVLIHQNSGEIWEFSSINSLLPFSFSASIKK